MKCMLAMLGVTRPSSVYENKNDSFSANCEKKLALRSNY